MKKRIWIPLLTLVTVLLVLVLGSVSAAADGETAPKPEVIGKQLRLGESVYLSYYVYFDNAPDAAEKGLLAWKTAPEDNQYTLATAEYVMKSPLGSAELSRPYEDEKLTCLRYDFHNLAADEMTRMIYTVPYVKDGQNVYYGALTKYSVYQYALNKLGQTALGTDDEKLIDLLEKMLAYGGSAQKYTNRFPELPPADGEVYRLQLVNGTFEDGSDMMLLEADTPVKANCTVPKGKELKYWQGDWNRYYPVDGMISISGHDTIYPVIDYPDGTLAYRDNGDGTATVTGLGTNTSAHIVVPAETPDGLKVTGIGDNAFSENDDIRSVVLPEGLETIGSSAFSGTYLQELELPASIKSIGEFAFQRSALVTSVTFPAGSEIESIGMMAFADCPKLTEVVFSGAVKKIDVAAFSGNKLLEKLVFSGAFNDSIALIRDSAFQQCPKLARVDLSNTSAVLEEYVFYKCTGLTYARLPETSKELTHGLFLDCTSLSDFVIPASVTKIKDRALYDCSALETLVIPRSVTEIGSQVVTGCTGLSKIGYDGTDGLWAAITRASDWNLYLEDTPVVYLSDALYLEYESQGYGTCVVSSVGTNNDSFLRIPEESPEGKLVVGIADGAFKDADCVTVLLPTFCSAVGESAFEGCSKLTSVRTNGEVKYIGDKAFSGCTALHEVSIGTQIKEIGASAFEGCTALTDFRLCTGILSFGDRAFYGCTGLKNVTAKLSAFPTDYTVGTSAFEGCTDLEYVALPQGAAILSPYAFKDCVNLKELVDSVMWSTHELGDYAFLNCSSLEYVNFEYNLTKVGRGVFEGCTKLTGAALIWNVGVYGADTPEEAVGKYGDLFKNCSSLTMAVPVPSSWKIMNGDYEGCTSLGVMLIPDTVEEIGENTFKDCTSLKRIELYPTLQRIDASAFDNCTKLAQFVFFGTPEEWAAIERETGWDADLPSYEVLFLTPSEGLNIDWGGYYGEMSVKGIGSFEGGALVLPFRKGDEPVASVDLYAFMDDQTITSVYIPCTYSYLGDSAFEGCSNLTDIYFGGDDLCLGERSFAHCGPLNELKLPALANGGYNTFEGTEIVTGELFIPAGATDLREIIRGTYTIKTVIFEDGATELGYSLLRDAYGVESLYLPDTVTFIGEAFMRSTNVKDIYYAGTYAQWQQIEKESSWSNGNAGKITLHCSDQNRTI